MSTLLEHPDDERFHIENVEPLITSVEPRGEQLEFIFRCPVSAYEATARVRPGYQLSDPSTGSLQPRLHSLVDDALRPSGEPTRISSNVSANWSVQEIEEAACDAFETVSSDFLWDGMRWTYWEAEDRVVEFLEFADILENLHPPQQAVLGKTLGSVARASGAIKASQEQLLQTLLGSDDLISAPVSLPSAAEFASVGSREVAWAVVAFAYAVACVDGTLDPAEEGLLDLVCREFGLGPLKQWELKRIAISFVVDEAFSRAYETGTATPKARVEVYRLAKALKLSQNESKDLEWRFLKRSGLA